MATPSITVTSDFDPRYPAPPRVHWLVLFIGFAVVRLIGNLVLPKPYGGFVPTLLWEAWAVYFCLWLRSLDPKATSIFWALGAFTSNSLVLLLFLIPEKTPLIAMGILVWIVVALAASVVCMYVARAELLRHYNQREPAGLILGPVVTFFFSYIYFQYHLYDIAESKRIASESLVA